MFSRASMLGTSFIAALILGLFIGYSLKPQVKVEVFDPAACAPGSDEFSRSLADPVLNEFAATNSDVGALLAQLKSMTPLVKAGPFDIRWNSTTGVYLIIRTVDQRVLVQKLMEDKEIDLSFYGEGGQVSCHLTYEKDTGRLIRSMFVSNAESGASGLSKCGYMDKDGDGRFDIMVDFKSGVRYEQKGLQWVELDRMEPRSGPD